MLIVMRLKRTLMMEMWMMRMMMTIRMIRRMMKRMRRMTRVAVVKWGPVTVMMMIYIL